VSKNSGVSLKQGVRIYIYIHVKQLKQEIFKSHKTEVKTVANFTKSEQIIRVRITPIEQFNLR